MVYYEDWNKAIFDYYFNKSYSGTVFFCVDEKSIENIGQQLGLKKEDAVRNFCRVVIEKCKKVKTIDLGFKELTIRNGVPYQTAVIAFTILAASTMRHDDDFTENNYWGRVKELRDKYFPEALSFSIKKGWGEDNAFLNMYKDFSDYVSERYYKFEFPILREYNGKKNDLVGRPMFQSMISIKDKCLLIKRFEKYGNEYEKVVKDSSIDDGNYSVVFRKIRDSKNYNFYLRNRVIEFYDDWKDNGFEYNEYNKLVKTRLKIGYRELDEGVLKFYYFLRSDENLTELVEFELTYINGEKYYCTPIEDETQLSLNSQILNISDGTITEQKSAKDYIVFKDVGQHYYIEAKNVVEGDSFSFLLNKDKIAKISEDYDDGYFERKENFLEKEMEDTNLLLLHNLLATNYGVDYIYINKKGKYGFQYGLKSDLGLYNYIKGAEPFFIFDDFDFIKVYSDDSSYKVKSSPLNLKKNYNETNKKYCISLEKDTRTISYKIDDIEQNSFEKNSFKHIYHKVTSEGFVKDFDSKTFGIICSGAVLNNFVQDDINLQVEESIEADIELINYNYNKNDNKIRYILHLLKDYKCSKSYPMSIKYKNWAKNCCDDNPVIKEVVKFINENDYIDNYINTYLKELGKVLIW